MLDSKNNDPLKQYVAELTKEDDSLKKANAESLLKAAEKLHLQSNTLQRERHSVAKEVAYPESTQSEPIDILETDITARLDDEFFALILELGGVKLAMPLVELGGIHKIEQLSKIPTSSRNIIGLLIKNGEKYTCIDLAKVVMPDKYADHSPPTFDYKFAVQLDKSSVVVACESVSDTIKLNKSDVKWRASKKKDVWNAGTVTSLMCALVDVKALGQELNAQIR